MTIVLLQVCSFQFDLLGIGVLPPPQETGHSQKIDPSSNLPEFLGFFWTKKHQKTPVPKIEGFKSLRLYQEDDPEGGPLLKAEGSFSEAWLG